VFTADGYGCQNNIVLDKLMWGLASLSMTIFFFKTLPWLFNHYKNWQVEHKRRQTSNVGRNLKTFRNTWLQHHNYSILSHLLLQISVLSYAVGCLYRAITGENMAVDKPITGIFLIWYFTHLPADGYLKHRTLEIFSSSLGNNKQQTQQLINFHGRMTWFCVVIALVGSVTCAIIGVTLPPEPTLERLYIALFRNIALLIMFVTQLFTDSYILRHLKISKSSTVDSSSDPDKGNNNNPATTGIVTSKMNALINHLEACVTRARAICGFFVIMMIFFNGIPMLYPFQYVLMTFLIIISGTGKSHPLHYFDKSSSDKNKDNAGSAIVNIVNGDESSLSPSNSPSNTSNMKRLNSAQQVQNSSNNNMSSSVGG
jgi:hypothetical protein